MANGLANRFLWLWVERSKSLPFGGAWHTVDVARIRHDAKAALAEGGAECRMRWGDDAKPLWAEANKQLTAERWGMFGSITARGEAQALRLAMIYALGDCSTTIQLPHVESALAVWRYAEESARRIFGDLIGNPDADKVLVALKSSGEDGLSRTEVSELFGRNKSAAELNRTQNLLGRAGRLQVEHVQEGKAKKPTERWYYNG